MVDFNFKIETTLITSTKKQISLTVVSLGDRLKIPVTAKTTIEDVKAEIKEKSMSHVPSLSLQNATNSDHCQVNSLNFIVFFRKNPDISTILESSKSTNPTKNQNF